MKKILVVLVLLISGLFISAGICNAELKEGPMVLKVKGLYLGMDIDEACKVISLLMESSYVVIPPSTDGSHGNYLIITEGGSVLYPDSKIYFTIYAGKDKMVNYILFQSALIDKLFGAVGISSEDFVREFIKAYKIPDMEPYESSFYTTYDGNTITIPGGWVFTSSNGYKVTITELRTLTIEPIAKKSEMKFD